MKHEEIQKIAEDFLRALGVGYTTIALRENDEGGISIEITSAEARLLIGTEGAHFSALNHLIRKIISKKFGDDTPVSIDVNGYQAQSLLDLKKQLHVFVERARSLQADVPLKPMSSYERMLVHSLCKGYSDIKTESSGVGKERRVIIKYVGP